MSDFTPPQFIYIVEGAVTACEAQRNRRSIMRGRGGLAHGSTEAFVGPIVQKSLLLSLSNLQSKRMFNGTVTMRINATYLRWLRL